MATSAAIDLGVDLASIVYFEEGYMAGPSAHLCACAAHHQCSRILYWKKKKQMLAYFSVDSFRKFSLGSILVIAILSVLKLWFQ